MAHVRGRCCGVLGHGHFDTEMIGGEQIAKSARETHSREDAGSGVFDGCLLDRTNDKNEIR